MPRVDPLRDTMAAAVVLARTVEEHLDAARVRLAEVPDGEREKVLVVLAAALVVHAVAEAGDKHRALAGIMRAVVRASDAAGYTIAVQPESCDCPRCRAAREADGEGPDDGPTIQ